MVRDQLCQMLDSPVVWSAPKSAQMPYGSGSKKANKENRVRKCVDHTQRVGLVARRGQARDASSLPQSELSARIQEVKCPMPEPLSKMRTNQQSQRKAIRSSSWGLQFADSFEEAEQQTREYWHHATPAERLNALETLREPFYGPDKASRRLQRFLELVPFP